jgi:hypothetical protein
VSDGIVIGRFEGLGPADAYFARKEAEELRVEVGRLRSVLEDVGQLAHARLAGRAGASSETCLKYVATQVSKTLGLEYDLARNDWKRPVDPPTPTGEASGKMEARLKQAEEAERDFYRRQGKL